jgi:signal transduction histidine kinase/FixJ family two-component response regulator
MPQIKFLLRSSSSVMQYGRLVPSIVGRLRLLVLAAMVPLIGVCAISEYNSYREQRAQVSEQLLSLSRSMAATVELELQTRIASLLVLAQSPSLVSGDLASFGHELDRFLSLQPPGAIAGLVDAGGNVAILAGIPGAGQAPFGHRIAREAAGRVLRTGRSSVSDYYVGLDSHRPSFSVDVPVTSNGSVLYDLRLSPGLGVLNSILSNQKLPPSWVASVMDATSTVLARSRDANIMTGRQSTGAAYDHILAGDHEAIFDSVTLDGTPVAAAMTRVAPFGWAVAVAVPLSEITTPLWRKLLITGGATMAALAVALLLTHGVTRTISEPILALDRFAEATEADAASDVVLTGLRETDAVAVSLLHEARRRRAAETGLQTLNQELEIRVTNEVVAREEAQTRAARAERMQALGQLSAGIAHDFNNVLQAVVGAFSIVERHADSASTVQRFAQIGLDAARRGSSVTGRLLAFARHSVLRAEPVHPAHFLEDLRIVLEPTLGAAIVIRIQPENDLPALLADRAQLETTMINLATNARDAMPDGGTLTLSANVEAVATEPAHPAGLVPGRYVRLAVTDTGTGIATNLLDRVTEPFFTTKEQGKGTGLGLSVAKGFAEQSKGGFAICSEFGHGTTACIWLLATDETGPAQIIRGHETIWFGTRVSKRILLVEDRQPVRDVLVSELSAYGYQMAEAENASAALSLLDTNVQIDLLISDLNMPGMDGISLIREVRKRMPGLRVILLTGYAGETASLALDKLAGASVRLLRKPVTGRQLADHAAVLLEATDGVTTVPHRADAELPRFLAGRTSRRA